MPIQFTILEQNQHFIIVDKAPNVNFHTVDNELGIVELVKQHLKLEQLFPVHRLDKMTSGLLVFGKTKEVAAEFGRLFETRNIEKYYLAVSNKKPKKKQGLIKGDMKKGRNGSYLLLKTMLNPAITQFFSYSIEPSIRCYLLKPHTGKTHQLRVAMKSIGAPILGDERYYPKNQSGVGHLHAWRLSFVLFNKHYTFQANPNWQFAGLEACLSKIGNTDCIVWPKIP